MDNIDRDLDNACAYSVTTFTVTENSTVSVLGNCTLKINASRSLSMERNSSLEVFIYLLPLFLTHFTFSDNYGCRHLIIFLSSNILYFSCYLSTRQVILVFLPICLFLYLVLF